MLYLRNVNVRWHSFDLTDILKMRFKEDEIERFSVKRNDLVVCEGGEPGRCAIWDFPDSIMFQKALHRVRCYEGVLIKYIALIFEYYAFSNILTKYFTGSTIKHLTGESLVSIVIPLPPLEEQRRIVAEIERWLSLIDIIEGGKANLQTAVKQAKSKILDLAIHGKLVPQDPADEPASELLRPKAEITSDNAQYGKVPKGWCLIKGKDLFLPMKSAKPQGDMFKYIDTDAIDNKSNIIKETKSIEVAKAPSRASRYTQKNDIVFSMVRPYLRNIAMVKEYGCIASTGFYICSPYVFMFYKYCYFLMLSDYVVYGLNSFMKGDNSPSINKGNIDEWTFPLPPLAEQHRIVAKIEELFAKLDLIEAEL